MKTSHDLSGLIKFLGRDDWQDRLQDVNGRPFRSRNGRIRSRV